MARDQYPDKAEMKRRAKVDGRKLSEENAARKKLSSSALTRLAERTGKSVEHYLKVIPKDTLARLKSPMRESVEEDGSHLFKDPIMVRDGIIVQTAGDQGKTHEVKPAQPDPED